MGCFPDIHSFCSIPLFPEKSSLKAPFLEKKELNTSEYWSSPKLCVNCSACIMLPSPGRQPAACVPAADAKEGHPCRAVKGCPAFGQRAVP